LKNRFDNPCICSSQKLRGEDKGEGKRKNKGMKSLGGDAKETGGPSVSADLRQKKASMGEGGKKFKRNCLAKALG